MKSRPFFAACAMFAVVVVLILGPFSAASSAGGALPQPVNLSCQGYAADTVRLYWKDTADDETEYRVERRIGGGSWSEVATLPADSGFYEETGVDTSSQNRFYRVRSYRAGDTSFSPYSDVCNNRRITITDHFRLFFGLLGTDSCPIIDGNQACLTNTSSGGENIFITLQKTALEGSLDAFTRLGFTNDAGTPPGSLDKIPINVVWCDGGGCAGGGGLGISPLLMETAFDLNTRIGDPVAWIVAEHEAFHFQQFKYPGLNDPAGAWVVEGQARFTQDHICVGGDRPTAQCFDDIATGYAGYVPEVMGYLANTFGPLPNTYGYNTALFWKYLVEKYGTSAPSDTAEAGFNIIVEFWDQVQASPGHDGLHSVTQALSALGHTETFRDVWKDFAVANYAKDITGSGVPSKYQYADMAQPGGAYGPVALRLSENLSLNEQVVDTDESVYQWGARYYEVRPDSNVPIIDIKFTQDSPHNVYYTVLAIDNNNLVYENNVEARNLDLSLINNSYEKVVVVIAALENLANYRYSFNGTQPTLNILSPTNGNKARVGDPASPDKFMVQVEIVDGDGVPLAGVDLSNFSFRIGTVDVPAGNILTSAVVQDKYWFVLRATTQTTGGQYNFQVQYGGSALMDTETNAVDYIPRNDADNIILLDRSGSMGFFNKLSSAQAAARLYVDSWRVGDQIGVIGFNDIINTPLGLTPWTDTPSGGSRQDAFDAINAFTALGGTSIGDALRAGWNELINNGDASHDWAMILLSDGEETTGTETFDQLIGALNDTTGKRPVVHAVAVGPDADRLRMQNVASVSGGTYQAVSVPGAFVMSNGEAVMIDDLQLNLDSRYRMIATEVLGLQQSFSFVGPDNDGEPNYDLIEIPVESGAAELIVSFSWLPSQGLIDTSLLSLRDPSNNVIPYFETDTRHRVWRVSTPVGGTWILFIPTQIPGEAEADAPEGEFLPPYLIQASLKSDVTMNTYLTTPVEERVPGAPMGIIATLTDTGPIAGAIVIAAIENPVGSLTYILLADDGLHGDGAAGDGVYGNKYYQTNQLGSYTVTIYAFGTSSLSGNFSRQSILSFYLDSSGDDDGDGLPNEWEIYYGTDPLVIDDTSDPDLDGVPTEIEWQNGTDPMDSDTDDGGESDGTDGNPLDPADDNDIPYLWGVAYPGDSEVSIQYNLENWVFIGFFRSTVGIDGPYAYLATTGPTGVYTDTTVTNGTEYCYMIQAIDTNGDRTPASPPTCATPNTDPLAPHGWVMINGGAPTTLSPDVNLTLWASDSVDPHNLEYERFLPPADSETGVTEMRISNYGDFHHASWEPYTTSKPWTMAGLGLRPVFVQYRDAIGNMSPVYTANIYVGSGPGLYPVYLPVLIGRP